MPEFFHTLPDDVKKQLAEIAREIGTTDMATLIKKARVVLGDVDENDNLPNL